MSEHEKSQLFPPISVKECFAILVNIEIQTK